MTRNIFFLLILCILSTTAMAQTREELEKQRLQLRKESEELEKQLNSNKAQTKESLRGYKLISDKVEIQDRVIDNISKDLRLLDNNIYTIQKDINRYDRLLDTLKKEYAKSMVYAYKNRGNYEFLNFIFSASSFNDAIKRVAYLKSYRNYQEIQGENILRTQELRKDRIADLSGSKRQKSTTLQTQSKEMAVLEAQRKEKDRILNELKKQGKTLNNQISAKKKQMQKVSNAIAAAVKKAQQDAMAKAAADERRRKEAEKKDLAKNNPSSTTSNPSSTGSTNKPATSSIKKVNTPAKKPVDVLLNAENSALNTSFEKNRGSLPWPVDKGFPIMHYGMNKLPGGGGDIMLTNVVISADIGSPVKAVFDGTVSRVLEIDNMNVIIIQHGKYFSTYSNLGSTSVSAGQAIKTGQVIGKVAANLDGDGAIDFFLNNGSSDVNPETWLRRR